MFRIHYINLALVAGGLALLVYAATPSLAGSYVSTYPAAPVASEAVSASSAALSPPNVLEYFYFSPVQPAKPASAGWVAGGQYSLPPGFGAVTMEASAFGSITAGPSGAQHQTFVVRLTMANNGTESLRMVPASMRFVDESGHLVTGATAYSGVVRISTDTVGPGGRDELQLEFSLPPELALKGLGPVDIDVPYAYGNTSYLTELRFIPSPPPSAASAAALPSYNESNVYNNYNEYAYPDYAYSDYYPYYAYYPLAWWSGWPWWWVGGDFDLFGHRHHFFEELFEHEHHEFGEHEHHEFGEHRFATSGAAVHSGATVLNGSGISRRERGRIGPGANVTTRQPLAAHHGFVPNPTEHALGPQVQTPRPTTEQHFAPQIQTPPFMRRSFAPQSNVRTFSPPSVTPRFTERSFSPPSVTPRFSGRSSAPQTFSAPRSFSGGFSGRGTHTFSGGGTHGFSGGGSHGFSGGGSHGFSGGGFHGISGGGFHGGGRR